MLWDRIKMGMVIFPYIELATGILLSYFAYIIPVTCTIVVIYYLYYFHAIKKCLETYHQWPLSKTYFCLEK